MNVALFHRSNGSKWPCKRFTGIEIYTREFISDEYTIRQVTEEDIQDWKDDVYNDEGLAFAEAVIEKYKECYILSVE